MDHVDCVVVGAGVVGLAVARAVALGGRRVLIVERERQIGMGISSRNSEVIHAGIYYPPDSLKAQTCVRGRALLYEYCEAHSVPHRRCGKLIVASSTAEEAEFAAIDAQARRNGVGDLEWLDARQISRREPSLAAVAALSSPSTGIIDAHAFMNSLLRDAETCGAGIAYGTAVTAMLPTSTGVQITIASQASAVVRWSTVVKAAGLSAAEVAAAIEGFPAVHIPTLRYAKGNYFALSGTAPFSRLIYPLLEPGGLGIHMTLDLAGRARFGPDVEWVSHIAYGVDPGRAASFYAAIRSYWPTLGAGRLYPAYAGVRPKLNGPGEAGSDFCLSGPDIHGVSGVINLFGIESPGLTAALALAQRVAMLAGATA